MLAGNSPWILAGARSVRKPASTFRDRALAADRDEAGKPERRIHADEADEDDFDNAHVALPFFAPAPFRLPMNER
jgi:hypothetical protein